MRQLAQTSPCDEQVGRHPDIWYEVERQEDDELDYLDNAPWLVFGAGGRLAKHLDRVRGVGKHEAMGSNEVGQIVVDQGSLFM